MNEQLELQTRMYSNDVLDDILSGGFPWKRVDALSSSTGLTRREIRDIASERGYAAGNKGIAKIERLPPEEQLHAFHRIRSQALSMLRRAKKIRNHMRQAGTYPLKGVS